MSPLVILLHGNTGWKEEVHIETLSQRLVAAGIATIRFDAPGSGESEGSWDKEYRSTNYIHAVKDVLDWAVENMNIEPSRVGVWGHSMGGMVAVQAAAKWPDDFAVLCGSQPSTGKAPQTDDWDEKGGFKMKTQIFGIIWLPKEFFKDRLRYNTAETVKKLTIPQLYIAGTEDKLVPVNAVQEIYTNAREPKQYEEFKTNHFYKEDSKTLQAINEVTVSFFKETLV